jgi:hypothetical protein
MYSTISLAIGGFFSQATLTPPAKAGFTVQAETWAVFFLT